VTSAADELKELVDTMLPWQRHLYEQLAAGGRIYWQGGRRGGKFMIARALKLRAEQEKQVRYINQLQSDVTEFHETFNHPAPVWPVMELTPEITQQLRDRATWMHEEATELEEALDEGNLVKVLDALGDSTYFAVGGFTVLGHDMMPFWNNIQAANMAKLGPDGKPIYGGESGTKIQKPEGWVPPEARHEEELARIQADLDKMDEVFAPEPEDLF
jgi:hypothetical protein